MLGSTKLLKSTSCIILNDFEFVLSDLSVLSPFENYMGLRKLFVYSTNQSDYYFPLPDSSNLIPARLRCYVKLG